jgi:hypothetical protein
MGGGASPTVVSCCQVVVTESLASKAMKTEAEDATSLEAITRKPVKPQQTEKTYCML